MIRNRTPLAASLLALSIALAAAPAHASGVAAGTLIQNTASATYSSGTAPVTIQSNTVQVRVDQLLDVAVAGLNGSPVSATSSAATISYSVTNTGNGSDRFNIAVTPTVSGNPYDGVVQTIAIDVNGNGIYDAGTDILVTNGSASPLTTADGTFKVVVVVALPAGAADAQASQLRLTATSVVGSGTPGTVFAGAGQGGVDAVVGSSTATSNALDSIIASLATVSLSKSAVVVDPFGGTAPVPGALVTYTIAAHFTGSGTAEGIHVTDAIPAGTTYQAGTLALDGTALSDATGDDAGTAGSSGIDVALGSLAGGSADKAVSFKVKIN